MTANGSRLRGRHVPPTSKAIDLTPKQRTIVQQIQEDQAELSQLEQRQTQLLARINANRGKLELIAELAEEYGQQPGPQLSTEEMEKAHA